MKKTTKVDYKELSTIKCITCGRPLKQNLINRLPEARKDYICYLISKGIETITQVRKVRTGRNKGELRKKIISLIEKQRNQIKMYKSI